MEGCRGGAAASARPSAAGEAGAATGGDDERADERSASEDPGVGAGGAGAGVLSSGAVSIVVVTLGCSAIPRSWSGLNADGVCCAIRGRVAGTAGSGRGFGNGTAVACAIGRGWACGCGRACGCARVCGFARGCGWACGSGRGGATSRAAAGVGATSTARSVAAGSVSPRGEPVRSTNPPALIPTPWRSPRESGRGTGSAAAGLAAAPILAASSRRTADVVSRRISTSLNHLVPGLPASGWLRKPGVASRLLPATPSLRFALGRCVPRRSGRPAA